MHPAKDVACTTLVPPLEEKAPGHFVACLQEPPTQVAWADQQAVGAVHPPVRFSPSDPSTAPAV